MVVRPGHVDHARAAGSGPRRDPRGGEGVALVAPVQGRFGRELGDPLSPFDRNLARNGLRVDGGAMLSQQEIGDQDDGELEGLREVESFDGGVEAVEGVLHRDDDARIVALRGPERLVQIALLGLGGNARGGPPPLDVDHDHRGLDHARHPDGLGHQRKAAAGGGAHGPHAGVSRADRQVDYGQLVLRLLHHHAAFLAVRGEPVEDEGGRAHGIGGVELAAPRHRPQRDHLVPRHHRTALAAEPPALAQGLRVGGRVLVARPQHPHVLVDDLLPLLLEGLGEDLRRHFRVEAHEVQERPQGRGVLHDGRELAQLGGDLGDGEGNQGHPFRHQGGIAVELAAVEDDRAPRLHLAGVALDAVLVEGDQHVQVVAVVVDLLLREPQAEPGVAAADQGLIAVVGEEVEPEASGGPGQGVPRPIQTIARRPCHSDRDLGGHPVCSSLDSPRRAPGG